MPSRTVATPEIQIARDQALHNLQNALDRAFAVECPVAQVRGMVTLSYFNAQAAKARGAELHATPQMNP